jgi:hypothetical protein
MEQAKEHGKRGRVLECGVEKERRGRRGVVR